MKTAVKEITPKTTMYRASAKADPLEGTPANMSNHSSEVSSLTLQSQRLGGGAQAVPASGELSSCLHAPINTPNTATAQRQCGIYRIIPTVTEESPLQQKSTCRSAVSRGVELRRTPRWKDPWNGYAHRGVVGSVRRLALCSRASGSQVFMRGRYRNCVDMLWLFCALRPFFSPAAWELQQLRRLST